MTNPDPHRPSAPPSAQRSPVVEPKLASSIKRIEHDSPTFDVMGGAARLEIPVHDHGLVALVDAMPRLAPQGQTGDFAIVQAARVSYGQGTKRINEDRGLIRYLMRHRHTTPFEMIEFKFHIKMPIFVARQWIRHRTANVNEYSARYSIVPDQFYRPPLDEIRTQSQSNRQGGESVLDLAASDERATAEAFLAYLDDAERLHERYLALTERGVSRELARAGLPVSVYTQWYWKCDLHNILRFLSLRLDAHAQREIRDYAEAMLTLIEPIVPITVEAFRDYELESMRLTRLEIDALRAHAGGGSGAIDSTNSREQREWQAKRCALGLDASPSKTAAD